MSFFAFFANMYCFCFGKKKTLTLRPLDSAVLIQAGAFQSSLASLHARSYGNSRPLFFMNWGGE